MKKISIVSEWIGEQNHKPGMFHFRFRPIQYQFSNPAKTLTNVNDECPSAGLSKQQVARKGCFVKMERPGEEKKLRVIQAPSIRPFVP